MEVGETLHVTTRAQWRSWLRKHHAKSPEIWLVFYTKASGVPHLSYAEAVEEALCFGWIDSVVKPHGPGSRAQRFSPRRPGSKLSELNRERARRMVDAGLMTPAGLAAAGDLAATFRIPPDILRALTRDRETWANFQAFPPEYQRIRTAWIDGARARPEVFETRLRYLLKMTKQNKQLGSLR